jgi:methyl-accepting chemotaxis protein
MLDRLSLGLLIRSVVVVLSLLVLCLLGLQVQGAVAGLMNSLRVLQVTDASIQAFAALGWLRADSSATVRAWNSDALLTDASRAYIMKVRNAEMPVLTASIVALEPLDFAGKAETLPILKHAAATLPGLQAEFWDGVAKPKAQRRGSLAPEYAAEETGLDAALAKISSALTAAIRGHDGFIDQMMAVKQLAWQIRSVGGNGSTVISFGLAAGHVAPEARATYAGYVNATRALWRALQDTIAEMTLPPTLVAALQDAGARFFDADYMTKRDRLMDALVTGSKPEMTDTEYAPWSVSHMTAMIDGAHAALAAAHDRASADRASAIWKLVVACGLLAGIAALAAFALILVNRRMVRPLHVLRDAMVQIAGGDLTTTVPFVDRADEIGALSGALATFQRQAVEKSRLEAEQERVRTSTLARQTALESHIGGFKREIGAALEGLGGASGALSQASADMTGIASTTTGQVHAAETSASDASANVATIAAASEELSASIAEIGRQVGHAARISLRAVEETGRTDAIVRGMVERAGKIGEVVRLISDIANQTNLLALNATIEAARAGDAGKGFTVVAGEVKSLAAQTARATEEITAQIAAVQSVTVQAVTAIQAIGATIEEVSTVANAIAANVEQQGSATQEIVRNTQEAARRTQEASETVGKVSDGAVATGCTAEAVRQAAQAVETEAGTLRERVDVFLANIRAA